MKRLCCNGWQRVRSTQSTGVVQLPGRGLEVPTTTPHYTWLYTFTELTPVQSLAELRGLQSLFLIPIFAQANGALLIQGGESGAPRSTVERKILGPSSFSTGFQTFLQHRWQRAGQRWKRSNTRIRSKLAFLFDHFDREGWRKWTKQTRISQSKRWVPFSSCISHRGKRIILKTFLTHQPLPS